MFFLPDMNKKGRLIFFDHTFISNNTRPPHIRQSRYRTRAIISRGLYNFYPIFHCGLYCRAVYNAEWLIFHDSFFTTKNRISYFFAYCTYILSTYISFFVFFHLHWKVIYPKVKKRGNIMRKVVVYNSERFVLKEIFLSLKKKFF